MIENYKSKLERVNGKLLGEAKAIWFYEPKEGQIPYVLPATRHTYTPDFYIKKKENGWIIVETKGIWDYTDRLKHLYIKTFYPQLDLRFVFTRSLTKTSKGAKQTYADICEGRGRGAFRGIKWQYADKRIPTEWLTE